ncbi:uncharacterized protein [Littorina saxatilis]|uniref:uncharacterized protein isoform X1 n=1 Tax=Littorina saxatilis TaxID=31220 RepID=UPI0038B655AD
MVSTVWLFVVSTFLYSVSILRVSDAFVCREDETQTYLGEEYLRTHCCKAYYNGYSSKWETRWSVKCSYGCCGEEDNQVCCPQPDEGLSGTEIGIIVGCTIFGVIVLVLLIVLFVWICKKCSTGINDYRGHKALLRDVYSAQTLDELFVPDCHLVSAPGTIVHPVINVNEPYVAIRNNPVHVVPSPFQPQPSALAAPLRRSDDLDFGNEENWDRWGEGVPFSTGDVEVWTTDTAHSAARGRDHPHSQPPPSYEAVVKYREQD